MRATKKTLKATAIPTNHDVLSLTDSYPYSPLMYRITKILPFSLPDTLVQRQIY